MDRNLPYRLRRIAVEEDVAFSRNASNLGDGLQGPNLIVGVHHRNKHGARRQCSPDIVRVDTADTINGKKGYRRSQALKKTATVENRWVFDLSGNDVAAPPTAGKEHTFQRVIIGFASAAGEYDLVRAAAQQRRHLSPCLFHSLPRRQPCPVLTGRITEPFRQCLVHCSGYLGRDWSRGIEVEINLWTQCCARS